MARRRSTTPPVTPVVGRAFTDAETSKVRQIIADWQHTREHPHPGVGPLEAIHADAGRTRGFKAWELDGQIDVDLALEEELT